MLKTLITLMRGKAAEAGEEIADRNALTLLDQQIRDVAASLEEARRALALALAGDRREGEAADALASRIADLENRTRAALAAGSDALAREGAEAIAELMADRSAAEEARARFAVEAGRLKAFVRDAESRLAALERGRRGARAAEAVRHLGRGRSEPAALNRATLREAEATLARLRERQNETAMADEILDELDHAATPDRAASKLEAAGFGPRRRVSADDVLAKLRSQPAA